MTRTYVGLLLTLLGAVAGDIAFGQAEDLLRADGEAPFLFLRATEGDRSRLVLAVWNDGTILRRRSRSLAGHGYLLARLDAGVLSELEETVDAAVRSLPPDDGRVTICSDCPHEVHRTLAVWLEDRLTMRTWREGEDGERPENDLWELVFDWELGNAEKVTLRDADTPTSWYWSRHAAEGDSGPS